MITLVLSLALARAPEPEGSADNSHFATAVAAWKEQRWTDAAEAFVRAYAVDPRPEYVFARAQALRFAGRCEDAIAGYREFIALSPPAAAIEEARGHIATCGGEPAPAATDSPAARSDTPAQRDPPAQVEASTRPDAPPPTADTPRSPPPREWWRDPIGHALGWTGIAAAAVGAGLVGEALVRRSRGDRAGDEQAYRDARRGGSTLLYAGIPLASIGGALVIAGAIRFAVVARSRGKHHRVRKTARMRHVVVPYGVGIAWSP